MSADPHDCQYSATHEWTRVEGGEAVVGITAFAQESLGDITYVDLPSVGDHVAAGKEFGSIESVKAASDLISPVDGEVVAVNGALEGAPELCNGDPYGQGWLMRVRLAGQPAGLMDAAAYRAHCEAGGH